MRVREKFSRFCNALRVTFGLISKLANVVGDGLAVVKMVDTVVDSFIERRRQGELQNVDAITYISSLCELVADISEYGDDAVDAVESAHALIDKYIEMLKDSKQNA